ncbi:hypothetical protein QFC19_006260 [Naganishia cerealis]|uniref:Uncharacterized protein n=1 Tax=Naganishia cerealis TaxID=610337 RepID=A0ACC2VHC8_9TREE|nr:hypothetical protein QFC19_006260 [Naganishia cerealis]
MAITSPYSVIHQAPGNLTACAAIITTIMSISASLAPVASSPKSLLVGLWPDANTIALQQKPEWKKERIGFWPAILVTTLMTMSVPEQAPHLADLGFVMLAYLAIICAQSDFRRLAFSSRANANVNANTNPRTVHVAEAYANAANTSGAIQPANASGLQQLLPASLRSVLKDVLRSPESSKIFFFLLLNLAYMFIQLMWGVWTNSLGLISDAIHMAFDCVALGVGLFASVMATWESDATFTYGYSRVQTLSGFANGIFLVLISIFIIVEGLQRIANPPQIMNMKQLLLSASYSPVMRQLLARSSWSVGVIISTLLINWTGYAIFDPIASLLIAGLIIASVIPLIMSSAKTLSLELESERVNEIRNALAELPSLDGVGSYGAPRFWPKDEDTIIGSIHIQLAVSKSAIDTSRPEDPIRPAVPQALTIYADPDHTREMVEKLLYSKIHGLEDLHIQLEAGDASFFEPQDMRSDNIPTYLQMATEHAMEPSIDSTPKANVQDLQVLVLVGLPGSGKSCLANALESTGRWIRASQDDAPNRRRQEAEAMTRKAIQSQRNAVIDRVGFDRKCTCVILDVKRETLETRLAARTGHPTLVDIDIAMRVLSQMEREYKPPRADQPEGYSRVYVLSENEQPVDGVWTDADLDELLRKLAASSWRDEPYVPPPPKPVSYQRRGYHGGIGTNQHGHYRGPYNGNHNTYNTPRGGGHHHQYPDEHSPGYDDTMQRPPHPHSYGHPRAEAQATLQSYQEPYRASSGGYYSSRPIYTQMNPDRESGAVNRSTNAHQYPAARSGHWRSPHGQIYPGANETPYPTGGNGGSYRHQEQSLTDAANTNEAGYTPQNRPFDQQQDQGHAHK